MKLKFFIVILLLISTAFSAKNEFLSKEYIDTAIQSAYYNFVAANNKEAGGTTQLAAINKAKGVVSDLKKQAQDDPNKRYILWRLSELEAQIGLEEEEVRLKQQYARVQKINELVAIFNKEVLQPRPNFANLHTLYARMSAVDVSKTNEFADIINQKNKSVTFNLKQSITSAFNNNNYGQAETDYNYIVENRKYLSVGNADIESWRKKIQVKNDADYLKENIDNRVAFVNGIVNENRLLEAKRHIEVLNSDLTGASALLTQSFVSSTNMKLKNLSSIIDRREDSLIQYGYSLLAANKHKEASDFLRNVLFPAGVDRSRTAGIDREIIEADGTQRKPKYESSLVVQHATEESGLAMSEAMKQKTKAKADSIRVAQEIEERKSQEHFEKMNAAQIKKYAEDRNKRKKLQNQCDDFLYKILAMFEQGKGAAAVKQFRSKQALCFENASPKLYYDVKVKVNMQVGASIYDDYELSEVLKKQYSENANAKQEKAQKITGEIYDLLDRKQVSQAYALFYFDRYILEQYSSYPESVVTLRKELAKAYSKEMGIKK